jgi:4-methylaminobutanoate oxidase (formaldehyde-forming)
VTLPDRARVVIIGGGVGGTSIAYHLARRGWRDVVLLERAQLTSGSTFHSAGLVGQLRSTMPLTRLMMNSVTLYGQLTAETGIDVGWHPVGSLRLASSPERMEELERQAGWATSFGLPLELVTAQEARRRFPLMTQDGVLGAAFLPTDGYLDPSGLTLALAEGARRGGARICEGVHVTAVRVDGGAVRGVDTEQGPIEAEVIVNAGGIYAPEIGAMAGLTLPIIPMAHQYLLARIKDEIPRTFRRCATPTCSSTSAATRVVWSWGATNAIPHPGASTASPAISTTACCRRIGRASSRFRKTPSSGSPRSSTAMSSS